MTNRIAIFLALIIIGALVFDYAVLDGAASLFLGKKLAALTEYMAFWR